MKYLLDTDHISILFFDAGTAFQALSLRMAAHAREDIGVSVVSLHEQFLGCHAFLNQQRRQPKIVQGYERIMRLFRLYAAAEVAGYDASAAAAFDDLSRRNLRIATMDLRIAAVALSADLILVTRNTADFSQVSDLQTEDWLS